MLLAIFMVALSVKDLHAHRQTCAVDDHAVASHHATVQADCLICDFVMPQADIAKPAVYVSVVMVKLLSHHVFTPQTVYRTVISVNSHSPPVWA